MTVWGAKVYNFEGDGRTRVSAVATSREDFIKKVCCASVKESCLCDIRELDRTCATDTESYIRACAAAAHRAHAALMCPWCLAWRYYDAVLGVWRDCYCT